ncbi:hypothetical protein CC2G_010367 [Coprinopsis cinerea AmutBmut pab1-1]|nr:hypothetical protein CC2G_010367 [Coprinopsis cinerea AmutBmut pab1-1]
MSSCIRLRLASSLRLNSSFPRSRILSRKLHERRPLQYPIEGGLGNFLPPPALKTAVEWQTGLLDRLNEEVKGTAEESTSVIQTVLNTSVSKERTLAFNYASLALNNSFFLDQLKPPPSEGANHEHEISVDLLRAIEEEYGSLRQLKSSISAAALGMFSNGWVWFVTDANGSTGILPTFGPGTLLVRSRTYMGSEKGLVLGDKLIVGGVSGDLPPTTSSPAGSATVKPQPPGTGSTSPLSGANFPNTPRAPDALGPRFSSTRAWNTEPRQGIFSMSETAAPLKKPTILTVGEEIYPLFCIPVYEHNWMSAGYGVWGKEDWLKEFWSVVNWAKVSKSYSTALSARNNFSFGTR